LQTTPKRAGEVRGIVDVVVVRKEKGERSGKLEALVGEFGYDIRHLVDVDELDPGFEIFIGVLPDELGVCCPTKMGRDALVALLEENPTALNAEMGLVQSELPTCERLTIATARLLGDVELETGPVKADRLADRFNVGSF
jgi:hypothetical protein